LTFHFYGNCLKFLLRLYSFTFSLLRSFVALYDFNLRGWFGFFLLFVWVSFFILELRGTVVYEFSHNLTVGQNIILAAPGHIWHWITRGRALDAHRRALLDLQMSAGANVMNPRRHWNGFI